MRLLLCIATLSSLAPRVCFAQGQGSRAEERTSAPPLLAAPDVPGQPPPSGRLTPGAPDPSGYPYSPQNPEELPAEVGLMITEAAFGTLTASGAALIPYFLLLKPMMQTTGAGMDPQVVTLIFALVFATVPLAVSQTELSLANGSRFFISESWPASLSGLGAQAAVLGLYSLVGGINAGGTGEALLIAGTVGFVPLVEMAVINLTKTPRGQRLPPFGSVLGYQPGQGLMVGLPIPSPLAGNSRQGRTFGLSAPLLSGRF